MSKDTTILFLVIGLITAGLIAHYWYSKNQTPVRTPYMLPDTHPANYVLTHPEQYSPL